MFKHAVNMIVITGLSLAVVALCAPNVKPGLNEIRVIQARNEVHRLRDEYTGDVPPAPTEHSESDVWGHPYQVEATEDAQIRIRSAGANGRFESSGGDDIWSDMPTSPMQPFRTRRNWEWARAFSAGIGVWLFGVWGYWRSVRVRTR